LIKFFGKCGTYFRQKIFNGNTTIEFSTLCYLLLDDANSYNLKDARSDINASFKYFGSKGYSLVEVKEHSDLKIFPVTTPKISEANIGKHRTFGQFHYMNYKLFTFKPNMLAVDFNLTNTVKFMIFASEAES